MSIRDYMTQEQIEAFKKLSWNAVKSIVLGDPVGARVRIESGRRWSGLEAIVIENESAEKEVYPNTYLYLKFLTLERKAHSCVCRENVEFFIHGQWLPFRMIEGMAWEVVLSRGEKSIKDNSPYAAKGGA